MHSYLEQLVNIGFLGAMMWGMLKFMLRDIHRDLGSIRKEISELKDNQIRSDNRIDRLYEICIELLRSNKSK